jgi:hypothetical protein
VSDKSWRQALVIASAMACFVPTNRTAHAEPPSFPDLSGFTPENVADYVIAAANTGRGEPIPSVYFLGPVYPAPHNREHDIACDFISRAAQCSWHDFPPIPSSAGGNEVHWITTDSGRKEANSSIDGGHKINGHLIKYLPLRHSIALDGVICGVTDARITACKDSQGRGFTLTPDGHDDWLPHV